MELAAQVQHDEEQYLERIRDWVAQRCRLHFGGRKLGLLAQRLDGRIQELGLADYRAYWEHLEGDPREVPRLLDLLTTNETFFFRNPGQFQFLRETAFPELEFRRGREMMQSWGMDEVTPAKNIMKLRILCAGCATGEEPYSAAITVLEGLRYPKAWDVEIVAGDLSGSCLEKARRGFYETDRLQTVPPALLRKYFIPQAGGVTVADELRELVRIIPLNLNQLMNGMLPPGLDAGWGSFDLVFCRNVMIYFSRGCQQLLVETLSRLLVPGGYLLTGDAEPLHLFDHDLATVADAGCLVYRKTENVEHD